MLTFKIIVDPSKTVIFLSPAISIVGIVENSGTTRKIARRVKGVLNNSVAT